MFKRIYLDHSATTPVDPRVLKAMLPYFTQMFGNTSSIHHFGQETRSAVDRARQQVGGLLNARQNEVIFTSGGTESNNLAIRGLALANKHHGNHLVTCTIEHPAVKMVCEDLEKDGFEVTYVPVTSEGLVSFDDISAAITGATILVTVMTANNEIGTIQPVSEIGRYVRSLRDGGQKVWFHTDAVQAAGKIPIDVEEMSCDLLTISGHKIYAPKGVGALYVRRGVRLHPQNIGGRQERGLRGGTESVPMIVGLGHACELSASELIENTDRLRMLRDRLEQRIAEAVTGVKFNGDRTHRIPTLANISFDGVEGEALLINLDMRGIAVSTGSACSSGSIEPSPVLLALGNSEGEARSAVRFSLGRSTTEAEIDAVVQTIPEAVESIRRLSS
jgi:cysteine desulfurase